MQKHYDIIIIGTGAGGGTLAYALASTGRQILLVDRGEYIPREKENWNPEAVYMNRRYRTDERWLNAKGDQFQPSLYHRVGGSTKVYGGALLRMRQADFEAMQHFDGVSPAWCLTYQDFEPYYSAAETLYRVHGSRGEDPTEPPTESDLAPALPHSQRIQQVADRLSQIGLHPFGLPMAIDRNGQDLQHSPCILCNTCDGYPCLIDAKGDAQVCCVDPAIASPNVTLLTGAQVDRLVTDSSGYHVQAIEATVKGEPQQFTADTVVVACGAINSATLLLRSANDQHPYGLANGSGMVGRNLMKHNATKLFAIAPTFNPTRFQKTLAINDFYFGSPEDQYPLGHVHLMGKHNWQMMQPDFPSYIPGELLQLIAARSVDWWAQSEDLPVPENRVLLNAQGEIQVHYRPNNVEAHKRLKQRFKSALRQAGFPITIEVPMPLNVMNHQAGTCRMGIDPEASVLDSNCKAHELNNLYVVDSSFFPSISAVNPTLTIVANALRVADHLKQRLGIEETLVQTQ